MLRKLAIQETLGNIRQSVIEVFEKKNTVVMKNGRVSSKKTSRKRCFGTCTRRFHRFKSRALMHISAPKIGLFLMFGSFKHVPHTLFIAFLNKNGNFEISLRCAAIF